MGRKGKDPHNALFLSTFGEAEHARSYLATMLPPKVLAHLDLSTLEPSPDHFVDEKLQEFESDLLFTVQLGGQPGFVYLLLEHQSTVDPLMTFRLLRYMVRIWDLSLRKNPKARKLPAIVPLVMCHAPSGWTAVRSFAELLDLPPELLEELRPQLPDFKPLIDDLKDRSDEELEALGSTALVRLVLLLFKHIRDGDLPERLPRWSEVFRAVSTSANGMEALVLVLMYTFECNEGLSLAKMEWLSEALEDPSGEIVMTLAEQLRQEGRLQGMERGRQQGQQQILLKLLGLRFGDVPEAASNRISEASPDELELWAERVLTASSIDEILGDEG